MSPVPVRTALQAGAALRRRRKAAGLSQSELAERIGVRQATISKLESGGADVRISTLMEAAAALGLELVLAPRNEAGPDAYEELLG